MSGDHLGACHCYQGKQSSGVPRRGSNQGNANILFGHIFLLKNFVKTKKIGPTGGRVRFVNVHLLLDGKL